MLPFKKVLCPIDFSDFSYDALEAALSLCSQFHATLILVHVIMPVPVVPVTVRGYEFTGFNLALYQDELKTQHSQLLDDLISERVPADIQVKSIILQGNEADEIVKCADDEDVDLIVISTHGRTGLKRMLLGSVAEKVMRHTLHPVLMIRSQK